MNYTRKRNLVLLLRHFLVNISTTNIEKVVSMLFAQHQWTTFPFQPNINVETTLGHQHWIDIILSTLFCQRWNNVNKHTSAQVLSSTKSQSWNSFVSSTLNRRNSINGVSMLFCQRWNNVDKCTLVQLSFSAKY